MTDWKSALRSDPIPWLLDHAGAAIRYRVLTELLERGRDDPKVQEVRKEMLGYPLAKKFERTQRKDGTWGGQIHAGDAKKYQTSTENVLWRLYEFGWDRETKTVRNAAKTLRQFQTAKKDIKFFEFAKAIKADERRERYYRWFLRILSLGLLIQAGYGEERSRLGRSERACPCCAAPLGARTTSSFPTGTSCACSPTRRGCWRASWPKCG
jgi:hypothetical protein